MLKLYDKNHNAAGLISWYKDLKIESDLKSGDKTLSFTCLDKHHKIENEMYIRTKDDEYVVKEVKEATGTLPEIVAILNLEDLQQEMRENFSVANVTITEAARTVLTGTGWIIGECDVQKRRNAEAMQVTPLGVIEKLCSTFFCEPVYDTVNKMVSFYAKRGKDRGAYFTRGLNLKKLEKTSNSHNIYTRIIPIGQDGLTIGSVNEGKNYLDNHQYTDKIIAYIWKDESYTDENALKEDAEKLLEEQSKPSVSYRLTVYDLAKQTNGYSVLAYGLGDTVTLIDFDTRTRDRQRVQKLVEYPQSPWKNTCEIGNTTWTAEDQQISYQETTRVVNTTISSGGRYTGKINVSEILGFTSSVESSVSSSPIISTINSSVANLNSSVTSLNGDVSTIKGQLEAVSARFGEVEANYLTAEEAKIKYATIEKTGILEANIHDLKGDYGEFKSLVTQEFSANSAIIDKLTGDLASFRTTMTQELVTAKGWMLEGSIGDAQISNLSANKLGAGTIDTAIITMAGPDGRLMISDNTIQIKDENRVRVQIGKDASKDYTMAVWDASGNLIWDALGATENTIQRKIIRDRMVADDANIQAFKIDYRSFATALTDQGVTISGTVVQVGDKTLNVELSEQRQTIQNNYTQLVQYTDQETGKVRSDASRDATNKANAALNNAKDYANTIKVGGRNLARGTSSEYSKPFSAFDGNANICTSVATVYLNGLNVGDTVTVHLYYKYDNIVAVSGKTAQCWLQGSGNITGWGSGQFTSPSHLIISGNGEHEFLYKFTVTAKQAENECWYINIRHDYVQSGSVCWKMFKVEKGDKDTDWTPAPEDFYEKIELTNATVAHHTETLSSHDTRIAASENAIKLKVSTQDFNSYKTTVAGAISTAKTEAINTAASDAKTYTNAQITTVNQKLNATNQEINVLKGQITLKVEQTDIDAAVQSLQIGGNNILYNSTGIKGTTGWRSYATTFASNRVNTRPGMTKYGFRIGNSATSEKCAYSTRFYLKPSTTYTISGYAYVDSTVKSLDVWVLTSTEIDSETDTSNSYTHTFNYVLATKNKWIFFTNTFTTPANTKSGYVRLDNNGAATSGKEGFCYFCDLMLVEGNKAVPWAPSVKDTEAEFAKYSTTAQMQSAINIAKSEITVSVSEKYATKTELSTADGKITNLTTRMSSAESKLTKDSLVTTIGNYYSTQSYVDGVNDKATAALNRPDKSNLITIGPSRLLNNSFTHLSAAVDSKGVPCVKGAASDQYLMFCDYTENIFNIGDIVYFNGTVPNYSESDITATLYIWFYDNNKKHLVHFAGTAMKLNAHSWNKCTGQVTVGSSTNLKDARHFLVGLQKSSTSAQIGLTTGSYAEKIGSYAQTIAEQTANKFSWIVKSGTGATDFTLTDRTATLIAQAINLNGLVTFSGLGSDAQNKISTAQSTADNAKKSADAASSAAAAAKSAAKSAQNKADSAYSTAGTANTAAAAAKRQADSANATIANWCYENDKTFIDGGKIYTGSITAAQLAANCVTAAEIDVGSLFAQDITATGTIRGVNLVGAKGSFSGEITATSGKIAGFTIGKDYISSDNATITAHEIRVSRVNSTGGIFSSIDVGAAGCDSISCYGSASFSGTVSCGSGLTVNGHTAASSADFWGSVAFHGSVALPNTSYSTTSGTYAVLDSNGQLSKAASSAKKYKDIGREVDETDIAPLYRTQVVWARYKGGYLDSADERCGRDIPMFIADNLDGILPIVVDHRGGQPETWNERIMIPIMFRMLQLQHAELQKIESQNAMLYGKLQQFESMIRTA